MNRQRTLDFFSKKRASTEVEQPTSNDNSTEIKASLMSALKKPKLDTISPIKTPVLKALPPKTYDVKIPFHDLAEVCEVLQNTPSRLSKLDQLESFFDKIIKVDSSQLDIVTNFLLNQLGPEYIQDLELGFGEHLIIKILQESFGYKIATLKTKLKEVGDLGQLTYKLRGEMKTVFAFKSKSDDVKISIDEAWKALNEIATISTHKEKIGKIRPFLSRMTPVECKFFVRFLEGKLRIGSSNQTIGVSMSRCMLKYDAARGRSKGLDQVEADRILRKVYSQVPNYSIIIDKFLEIGLEALETQLVLQPGIPLKPMLAKPCKSALDALAEFDDAKTGEKDKFICEYKYDGERIQFHQLDNGTIKIFSRNSEDMTGKYPELVDFSKFYKNKDEVKSLIIDGEIVAYDIVEDKILPFQILTTRKRKNVEVEDIKVKVCIYVFDILCLNGKSLLEETLEERRRIYMNVFESKKGELQFANNLISDDEAEISAFLDQSVQDKCEGLMVKALTGRKSFYQPASRSKFWMKLKKDYLQGVGDSLDLIIMGAYFGKGKRTGFYGGFLLGSYNPDNDEIETCCKIGTGFSDEHLELLHKTLKEYESDMAPSNYMYDSQTKPDIWFSQPKLLLEVLCADLSLSPVYKSAIDLTGNNRGISLRFPRMLRIRDDKDYTMATSSEQVLEMYQSQANLQ